MSVRTLTAGRRGTTRSLVAHYNAPPTGTSLINVVAPSIVPDPVLGIIVIGDKGSWLGEGTITYVYQWYRVDPVTGGSAQQVTGQNGTTYSVTTADIGHALRLKITATDDLTTVVAQSAWTIAVADVEPVTAPPLELPGNNILSGSTTWEHPAFQTCNGRTWVGVQRTGSTLYSMVVEADNHTITSKLVASLASNDDHSSPAVIAKAGQVPIAFWTRHGNETVVRTARAAQDAAIGHQDWVLGTTINFSAICAGVTYAQAQVIGDTIHLWTRLKVLPGSPYYGYTRSMDWGLTWSAPRRVFYMGFTDSTDYNVTKLAPDGRTIRRGGTDQYQTDPRNQIRYHEIDTVTGDIHAGPGGPVLGNIYTGTGLPINVRNSPDALVRQVQTGWHGSHRDTGANAVPEMSWVEYNVGSPESYGTVQATATYWYGVWTGTEWKTSPICKSGAQFGSIVGGDYFGGCQFTNVAEGDLILSRRSDAGEWTIERWRTADQGDTWVQIAVIDRSFAFALSRVRIVNESLLDGVKDNSNYFKCVYNKLRTYGGPTNGDGITAPVCDGVTTYTNWICTVVLNPN